MTRSYHAFYRRHMIRSPYNHKKRPILINNWEATYFDFDTDKLLDIAREAKKTASRCLLWMTAGSENEIKTILPR